VGNLDKRVEDLEQRLAPQEPVRIRVVEEGPPGEERKSEKELYTIIVEPPESDSPETRSREDA
jgi:hypothetical protein